ncbi:phage tail protein [Paenibacillus tyrfis]|uniref:phage tail protein n=1 Tax=Paenibacillus tyrfis TaxID=1501230 RepID=UPI000691A02C|nr:phage tail protein [Paenibacillus tyrfis]
MIDFTSTRKELKQATVSLRFVEKNIPKAFSAAMNRVSAGVKTEAAKKVRETYYVKHGDVLKTIKVSKANPAKLEMLLTSRGPSIPLIKFRTTPSTPPARQPKVLKAAVKKEGGKKPIRGAFVVQMGSGHVGVFRRAGKKRLPVDELYGPSIPVMLGEPGVAEHLQEEAQRRMGQRLDHEVNRVLGRFKP